MTPGKVKQRMREASSFVHTARLTIERTRFCLHQAVILRTGTRKVICAACDAELDAFDVLLRDAKEEGALIHQVESRRLEVKRLQESIEELRRERQNLRAQVKRSSGKDGSR